jgi:signal transduction histidine kinase
MRWRFGRWEWPLGASTIVADRAFARLLGFQAHALPSRIDDWRDRVPGFESAAAWSALTSTLRGELSIMHAELPLRHRDGQVRWFLLRGGIVPAERHGGHDLAGIAADITNLKRVEEPSATTAVRQETLPRCDIPDSLYLIRQDGATPTISVFQDPLSLASAPVLAGRCMPLVLSKRVAAEFRRCASQVLATGQSASLQYELMTQGQRRTYDTRFVCGANDVVLGIVRDLTGHIHGDELNRLRVQLTIASRLQAFYTPRVEVLHQVSQPLTAILTNAQAAQKYTLAKPPRLDAVQDALRDIVRVVRRSRGDLSRVRRQIHGRLEARPAIAINQSILEALALVRPRVEAQHIAITTQLAGDLPMVRADRGQLQHVLVNLLVNAAEALADVDGVRNLSVRSWQGERGVLVAVSDTGSGIQAVDLERVFVRFYTTKPTGLGVGLWLSRMIIETHGGQLRALPDMPIGATFEFNLPADG